MFRIAFSRIENCTPLVKIPLMNLHSRRTTRTKAPRYQYFSNLILESWKTGVALQSTPALKPPKYYLDGGISVASYLLKRFGKVLSSGSTPMKMCFGIGKFQVKPKPPRREEKGKKTRRSIAETIGVMKWSYEEYMDPNNWRRAYGKFQASSAGATVGTTAAIS